jgi:hypothetical protein
MNHQIAWIGKNPQGFGFLGAPPVRLPNGTITFADSPEFRPNLTPEEVLKYGKRCTKGRIVWRWLFPRYIQQGHFGKLHGYMERVTRGMDGWTGQKMVCISKIPKID